MVAYSYMWLYIERQQITIYRNIQQLVTIKNLKAGSKKGRVLDPLTPEKSILSLSINVNR
jgi:hypothetical protein